MTDPALSAMPVIIIGAGIAGLTVARDLSHRKISCVVLEAQNRIGGRIFTKDGFDLGASWLHDVEDNAFFEIAKQKKLDLAYDLDLWFYDRGEVVDPSIVDEAMTLLQTCSSAPPSQSLRDFAIASSRKFPKKKARQVSQIMQLMEHWAGMSWNDMPARYSEPHINGQDAFNLSGNNKLVDWIYDSIDFKYVKVELNTPINQISRTTTGLYVVSTETNKLYSGPAVVCTMSVGAMKSPTLFNLDLPIPLRRAISEAPMAALGKVFFTFDNRWWDDRPDRMEVFGLKMDPPQNPDDIEPGDLPVFFTNAHKFTGKPILAALVATPLTERLEAHPEDAFRLLKPSLMQLRRNTSEDVPIPKDITVTDWTQNRFFKGSYSGILTGQDEAATYSPFYEGYEGLRFAGEHATDDAVGTMHAAYVSGKREAERVAQICGQKRESRM